MKYFLGFDFYNANINKFCFGVVTINLKEQQLMDVAKQMIRENFIDVDPQQVTIKITALNNIEI